MSFSKTFIDEIKDRSNIEDIIGAYLPLKRAGGNLVGLCPFHNEKTPSFTVYPGTSSYYCFGCGSGGDVFTFVMQHEGLDYPSAVERLAKIAG
ncbi:MAG: CHC2 zinc finger domain-containing protein, partial [Clostridia bacterium]